MSASNAANPALAMALRRGRLSDQLLAESLKPRNVGGHVGGLAMMGEALINGLRSGQDTERIDRILTQDREAADAQIAALYGRGPAPAAPATDPAATVAAGPEMAEQPAPRIMRLANGQQINLDMLQNAESSGDDRVRRAAAGVRRSIDDDLAERRFQQQITMQEAAQRRAEAAAARAASAAGRERFSAPTEMLDANGQRVAVMHGDRGTLRRVEGFSPVPSSGRAPQTVTTQDGIFVFNPDGTLGNRIGSPYQAPQQPPQPSESERRIQQYITLEQKRVAGTLTQEETLQRDLLARQLLGQDQVAVGPSGVAVVSPAPLPQLPGAPGSGNTIPLSAGAPPGPVPGAAPMPTVAVPQAAAAPPDASRLPVPGQRPGVQIVTPGGRTANYMPAEPAPPSGYQRSVDGTAMEPVPGGPADRSRQPLTEAEAKSNLFGQNMQAGHQIIQSIGTTDAQGRFTPHVPSNAVLLAWRNAPESLVNMTLSENDQRYFNGLRQFAAGVLRKETGAAFGAGELLDIQSRFFPMPGDTPASIRQKAEARQRAIGAMQAEIPGGFRNTESSSAPSGGRIIQYDAQGRRVPQ